MEMELSDEAQELFKDRQQLEELVENLQMKVKLALSKLEEIRELTEKLKEHEAEIRKNANFQITVTKTELQKINIDPDTYVTNCQVCNHTCHYPCKIPNNEGKQGCTAMGNDGYCTVCEGKCIWSVHYNQDYRLEYSTVTQSHTLQNIKDKYDKAQGAKASVEAVIRRLEQEYMEVQLEVSKLIEKSTMCLNRLKELALSPDPLSAADYVGRLIQGERNARHPGWERRVAVLIVIQVDAEKRHRQQQHVTDLSAYMTVLLCYYLTMFCYVALYVFVGGKGRAAPALL